MSVSWARQSLRRTAISLVSAPNPARIVIQRRKKTSRVTEAPVRGGTAMMGPHTPMVNVTRAWDCSSNSVLRLAAHLPHWRHPFPLVPAGSIWPAGCASAPQSKGGLCGTENSQKPKKPKFMRMKKSPADTAAVWGCALRGPFAMGSIE